MFGFLEDSSLLLMDENPAPVDMVNIALFTRSYTSKRWLFGISEPSTVCHWKLHGLFPDVCGNPLTLV